MYLLKDNHVQSIPISSLQPGDKILIGPFQKQKSCSYSPVLYVHHSPRQSSSRYLSFKTSLSLRPLQLSLDHVVCVIPQDICNSSFRRSWTSFENILVCHPANLIQLGDCLVNSRFQVEKISSIVCGEEWNSTVHKIATNNPRDNLVVNDYIVTRIDDPPLTQQRLMCDEIILRSFEILNHMLEWIRSIRERIGS